MTAETALWIAGGVGALVCVAVGLCVLLRVCGVPGGRSGAAVVGGILAGVLLGPGVAGRAAPEAWARAFEGGVDEQRAVEAMEREHAREVAAVEQAGVTPVYVDELRAKLAREIRPRREALAAARAAHRGVTGGAAGVLAALVMVLVGILGGVIWRAGAHRARATAAESLEPIEAHATGSGRNAQGVSMTDALGGAGFAVVMGLLVPVLVVVWGLGAPVPVALGVGLSMGVLAIGAEVRARLAPMAVAGVVIGSAGVGWLAWQGGADGFIQWIVGAGVVAMIAVALLGGVRLRRRARRGARFLIVDVGLAVVAALATVRCDPTAMGTSASFWVVGLTAVLISSDGRWVGIGWAQRLFPRGTGMGRTGARAWSGASGMVSAGTAMAQIVSALVLEQRGVISSDVLGGLVLGAAAIELSRAVRARVGWMMDGGETP